MRFLTVGLCLLGLLSSSVVSASSGDFITADDAAQEFALLNAWKSFKTQFDKSYETPEIDNQRFSIFVKNLEKAQLLNSKEGPHGAKFGVTKFMDLEEAEFRKNYLGYRPQTGEAAAQRLKHHVMKPTEIVDPQVTAVDWRLKGAVSPVKDQGQCGSCWAFSTTEEVESMHFMKPTEIVDPQVTAVDWRLKGAVSPVKDQGQCGSCWAFSTTEEVESMHFMKHGELPILSPQQIVSCDTAGSDQGCNGGDTVTAYAYVKQYGLDTEASYPYSGTDGTCLYSSANVAANITGYSYATTPCYDTCTTQNEATLLNNLASHGPVSICVDASSWQLYMGGVLTDASSCPSDYTSLDHCVQLVGYQASSPNSYWIVKNSWAASWGESGYIYVKYGGNLCGIADEATFATSA